ncbi:MAG: hypothetical protein AB8E74_09320 [Prochlorococcus sp.]|jgi:hypothetical protein
MMISRSSYRPDTDGVEWHGHRSSCVRPNCCPGEQWVFIKEWLANGESWKARTTHRQWECQGCSSIWESWMDSWPRSGEPVFFDRTETSAIKRRQETAERKRAQKLAETAEAAAHLQCPDKVEFF